MAYLLWQRKDLQALLTLLLLATATSVMVIVWVSDGETALTSFGRSAVLGWAVVEVAALVVLETVKAVTRSRDRRRGDR